MPFSVPRWVAGVVGENPQSVALESEVRKGGLVRLRYRVGADARAAEVTVRTMRDDTGRVVGWEAICWVGRQPERIEVPAGTRFEWR